MTDAADASDTSCSPDLPPKITPTRSGDMPRILAGERGSTSARSGRRGGNGRHQLNESVRHQPAVGLRNPVELDLVAGPERLPGPRAQLAGVDPDRLPVRRLDDNVGNGYSFHLAVHPPEVVTRVRSWRGCGLVGDGRGLHRGQGAVATADDDRRQFLRFDALDADHGVAAGDRCAKT